MNQTEPVSSSATQFIIQSDTVQNTLIFNSTEAAAQGTVYADVFLSGAVGAGTCGADPSSGFACILGCKSGQSCRGVPDVCPMCGFFDFFSRFSGGATGRSCGSGGTEYNVTLTLSGQQASASLCFSEAKQIPLSFSASAAGRIFVAGETLVYKWGPQPPMTLPQQCACPTGKLSPFKKASKAANAVKVLASVFGF